MLMDLVAFGEGCLVVMAMLSEDLRKAAYRDRHVSEKEQLELEQVMASVAHVVLVAPLTFPLKSYLPLLREYVPEIVSIIPPTGCSVLAVIPEKDAGTATGKECASWILGAQTEMIQFPGPAYRTNPKSPLVLYQLYASDGTRKTVQEGPDKPPTLCAETWAGVAGLSQQLTRMGFTVRAYERSPTGKTSYLAEGDVERPENQAELADLITTRQLYNLHVAVDCKSWTPFQNLNKTTRTLELPQGDGTLEHEKIGNQGMAIALWLILLCVTYGVFFTLEHPKTSRVWRLPIVLFLLSLTGMYLMDIDQCAWAKRPGDWDPSQGDVRTRKSTYILTNNPYLRIMEKRCADVVAHHHRTVEGASATGVPRSVEAGAYAEAMCMTYAQGLYNSWTHGTRPEPIALAPVKLAALQENIALPPPKVNAVAARAVGTGDVVPDDFTSSPGASSSGGAGAAKPPESKQALEEAGVPENPTRDYWMETPQNWIRVHVVPRNACFVPGDSLDGPGPENLQPTRVTEQVFETGSGRTTDVKTHNWTDPHQARCRTRQKWIGRSTFTKKEINPEAATDTATVPKTGAEIKPESPESLRAGLAGLRTKLIAAQRIDPRLAPIVANLKKEPKGSYIAEPYGPDNRKVSKRALQYRLASDGLLVAKEEHGETADRPVIPDVPHEAPGAPKNMTWKHLMLGSMHNTVTGAHRRAEEMYVELNKLVAWWPPEDLMRACKEWRKRCKLCTSVHCRPQEEAHFHAVRSFRPFYRLQIDLLEIKPTGEGGERYLLTTICVCTRYPFLRATGTRDAPDLALLLLDVILDMGVVPAVVQSDNEFVNLAFEELTTLLGAAQLFSAALRPQSQGIVERSHRDLRAALAIVVEAFIRACPRKWPNYVRYLEARMRHKTLPTGHTPYQAVHGFYGSTALGTALGAIQEIPEDLIYSDWLQGIVAECKSVGEKITEHWEHAATVRARKHGEQKIEASFKERDLVLIQKPFFERGTGSILPQCDGPFLISRVPTSHTAILEDPLTGDLYLEGKPVSVARLIRYHFPVDWAGAEANELAEQVGDLSDLANGDYIAVEPKVLTGKRIHVARIERVYRGQGLLQVVLYHVPTHARFGPWQRRPWEIRQESGRDRSEVITADEVLCKVELKNQALTQDSLEKLALHGVATGTQPSRDASLPPRTN